MGRTLSAQTSRMKSCAISHPGVIHQILPLDDFDLTIVATAELANSSLAVRSCLPSRELELEIADDVCNNVTVEHAVFGYLPVDGS